ncbi:MAG: rhodanese-like domain-containing protein [Coprothermobacterota bacterium]|nr:rhodanese-like domain-containing protein [Coprothermobacterota bacterium]
MLCPAHGAGSLCGGTIAERAWTTIGLERKSNPALQSKSREEFRRWAVRRLEYPPYFSRMERWNLNGAPSRSNARGQVLGYLPMLPPLSPAYFTGMQEEALVLDLRSPLSYCAAHIPGSLSIWEDRLTSFAGWFLPEDRPILLVSDGIPSQEVLLTLLRMGFDRLSGYLQGGFLAWQMAGLPTTRIAGISAADLCAVLDSPTNAIIVDVRNQEERERDGVILESLHIPLVELPGRLEEILRGGQLFLLCGSGVRSVIAASLLERAGWHDLAVVQGGMTAWNSQICPPPHE